jgi:hypothetical protein
MQFIHEYAGICNDNFGVIEGRARQILKIHCMQFWIYWWGGTCQTLIAGEILGKEKHVDGFCGFGESI